MEKQKKTNGICPLCEKENHCAMQRENAHEACWCFGKARLSVDGAMKNRLDEAGECLCEACYDKLNRNIAD